MQEINENIKKYLEGNTVPYCALYCEFKIFGLVFDVSKYIKTNPDIEDSADYQENITRLNEISIVFNNSDNVIRNFVEADTEDDIEVALYRYPDIPDGINYKVKVFGGYVDKERSKFNDIKSDGEIRIIPFYGKSERNALRLTRKYIDENGLRLNNCELWLRNANVPGYVLKNGVHEISVKLDAGYPFAKLDDGEWTPLGSGFETTLQSQEDVFGASQKCVVFYIGFSSGETKTQKIIVKNEGEQYPDTFYFYPTVREVITKAYNEMDVTDIQFDRFLIPTVDGRRVLSGTSRVDNDINNTFKPVSIVSNGADKIYIAGSTGAFTSPFKNQIWEYNHVTNGVRLIYETTLNINTKYKLIWDDGHLIAFIDNKETDEERGFIQYFTFGELGIAYSTVLSDNQFNDSNPYYRFHYSKFLKSFVYMGFESGVKKIISIDVTTGTKTVIASDNTIELNGFNFLWDNETVVEFYYIKTFHGFAKRLYKVAYQNGWQTPEQVCDWFDNSNYNYYYGYPFVFEGKIFIQNYDRTDARFFSLETGEFTGNLCPDNIKIYSAFEVFEKLYFIKYDTSNDEQRICYFSDDEITVVSFKKITSYDLVSDAGIFGFQQLTEFTDINNLQVIGALSKIPSLLLKFADNIEPFIEGELDTEGESIRDIIENIANNYLAWVRVNSNNKGFFVKRAEYKSDDVLTLKKKYTKQRVTQDVYNDVYDGVEITNANNVKYSWGDAGINNKVLKLTLPYIPDDFVLDAAKYFYDFYSTERKLMRISYIPTIFNYEALDGVNLEDYGLTAGILHTIRPGATSAEIEVLYE